jgi:hypothetical protein
MPRVPGDRGVDAVAEAGDLEAPFALGGPGELTRPVAGTEGPARLPLGSAQASLSGAGDGRGAVGDLQLGEHCGDVVALCLVRQCQPAGDL